MSESHATLSTVALWAALCSGAVLVSGLAGPALLLSAAWALPWAAAALLVAAR